MTQPEHDKAPDDPAERDDAEERPPVLGSWRALYWLLIVVLLVQIGLYALLTQVYS